jgi:hypothetical protein
MAELDRYRFYDNVRDDLMPALTGTQIAGMSAILDLSGKISVEHLACCLAIVFDATNGTMQPVDRGMVEGEISSPTLMYRAEKMAGYAAFLKALTTDAV